MKPVFDITRGSPAWWQAFREGCSEAEWHESDGHTVMTALVSPGRLGAKYSARTYPSAVIDIRVNFAAGCAQWPEWWGPTGWEPIRKGGFGFQLKAMAQMLREKNAREYYGALECEL